MRWPGREDGAVLLVVLAALTILTLLATAAADILRSRAALAEAGFVMLEREAAIRSAVALGAAHVMLRGELRWLPDGRAYELTVPGARGEIRIQAVGGLINVNRADAGILKSLLAQFTGEADAKDVAEAIVAARKGRMGSDGKAAAPPRLLAFPDLTAVAPIFAGRGALWSQAAPFLTIYGPTGSVDPITAPREVLAAMPGMSAEDLRFLLTARAAGEARGPAVQAMLTRYRPFLTGTDDGIYRIRVRMADDGRRGNGFSQEAVIMTGRDPKRAYRVLQWGWPEEGGS
jgi:general secretion pathway protein K